MKKVHMVIKPVFALVALLICTASSIIGDDKAEKHVQFFDFGEKFPAVPGPAKEVKAQEQLYADGYVEIGMVTVGFEFVGANVGNTTAVVNQRLGQLVAENGGELYFVNERSVDSDSFSERPGGRQILIYDMRGVSHIITTSPSKPKEREFDELLVTVWRRDPERAKRKLLDYRGKCNLWEAVSRQDLARVNATLAEGIIPTRFADTFHPEPKEKR